MLNNFDVVYGVHGSHESEIEWTTGLCPTYSLITPKYQYIVILKKIDFYVYLE